MKLLWIDTETGGLNPEVHSLLTLGMVVQHVGLKPCGREIAFAHQVYTVDSSAMAINGIDLVVHHPMALPPNEAVAMFKDFLDSHFDMDEKVMLAGHNVGFDIAFLVRFLRQHAPYLVSRFSHRIMDTMSLAVALQGAGLLPDASMGLTDLLKHYSIEMAPRTRHTALGDALATEELFRAMVASLRPRTAL